MNALIYCDCPSFRKTLLGFRLVLAIGAWMLSLTAPAADAQSPRAASSRPSFVFFLTDDQPYSSLGCTGNTVLKTPAMDRLAAEGVIFDNAFVTTSICCCSRASILTGQHMRRHGIEDFERPLTADQLEQTFPVRLRRTGYRTAFVGKYAIGSPRGDRKLALPADKFDLWYGFPQGIEYKQREAGRDRYLTTVMTERSLEFLRTTPAEQPFCLIVALKEPHGPLDYFDPDFPNAYADVEIPIPENLTAASFGALPQLVRKSLAASPRWITSPESFEAHVRQRYAYLSRADRAVAEILEGVAATGRDNETVVLFASDNGDYAGAHALTGKWLMHEESIRIPLIIRDPRLPKETRGRRSQMALNIDIAPTILSMAGLEIPPTMQGEDLQPWIVDAGRPGRTDWYYEHVYSPAPARQPIPKVEGVRTERWKYTRYPDASPPVEQLFDLVSDPHEEHDLAPDAAHLARLQQLRSRCAELRTALE